MKKISIVLLIVIPVFSGFAQSAKVVTAYRYLKDYETSNDPESLNRAKIAIDTASINPDTKDLTKTQVYRGQIYLQIYESNKKAQETKLINITDPNKREFAILQNTPTDELEVAYQAFSKAKSLDKKGNYTNELKAITNIGINFDNTGRADFNAKKYPEALNAFERTYEISSNTDTTALAFCGIAADMAKDYPKAKTYYQKMIDGKQNRAGTYSSLVNAYFMLKDTMGGLEVLKKGRATFPNDGNLIITETNYYLKTNKTQEALANLDLAI
jgi:tetratricopeptide (TPR) repeat protein